MTESQGMTRRTFLSAAATVPLVLRGERNALATAVAGQARRPTVGLELFSVRGELPKDLPGTLGRVAAIGYETVEFYSPYLQWTVEQAKEVKARLDDLGISCKSTHNGAAAFTGDGLKKAIELNQIIGSSLIVMASPPRVAELAGWRALGAQMTEVMATLRPLKMAAGYHNHQAEWRALEGQRPMDVLAASTPKDFVLQFDVGTCLEAGGDPVAWVKANPGRIKSMHCKDWGAGEGRGYAVAFGEGDVPWRALFAAAESVGGIENYLIEQEVAGPAGEFAMVEKCLANYRRLRA